MNYEEIISKLLNQTMECCESISDIEKKADVLSKIATATAIAYVGVAINNNKGILFNTKINDAPVHDSLDETVYGKTNNTGGSEDIVETNPVEAMIQNKIVDAREALKPKPDEIIEIEAQLQKKMDDAAKEASDNKKTDSEPVNEWTNEWTDEAMEYFNNEIEQLDAKLNEYGEEAINEVIVKYSSGIYQTTDDLSPLNIRGFLLYLRQLEKEADEMEDEAVES